LLQGAYSADAAEPVPITSLFLGGGRLSVVGGEKPAWYFKEKYFF
jgi:hypothetical protein